MTPPPNGGHSRANLSAINDLRPSPLSPPVFLFRSHRELAARALMVFPQPGGASLAGSSGGVRSLVQVIDRTVSTGGARHLRMWLRQPSSDAAIVTARLGVVSTLVACTDVRSALRERKGEALSKLPDLERIALR